MRNSRESLRGRVDPMWLINDIECLEPYSANLEINGECGDLLRQTEKIDGSVEEIWFKLGLQINRASPALMLESSLIL